MPLAMTCACGKSLRVQESLAGRKFRCPGCGEIRTIPAAEEALEHEALDILLSGPPVAEPPPTPSRPAQAPQFGHTPFPRSRMGPYHLKGTWRRKPKAAEPKPTPPIACEDGWLGNVNAASVGGFLMMVIAVIWFAAGWAAGYLVFFPPLLLVIGMIALAKGLLSGE